MSEKISKHSYLEHLSKDTKLKKILKEPYALSKKTNLPLRLYIAIINQQLSTRVGQVIYQRFLDIYDGKEPTSQQVVDTSIETLRAASLSNAKANYIKNVAQFDLDKGINARVFSKMADEEAIAYLTSIKGIGKWTAHIFLMSALGREDIFPADDLVLQKAVAMLYKLDRTDKKKFMEKMHKIAAKWSPYRSYASLHLWRMKP